MKYLLTLLLACALLSAVWPATTTTSAATLRKATPTARVRTTPTPTPRPKATPTPTRRMVQLTDVETISEGVYRASLDGAWALLPARTTRAPRLKNGRWDAAYLTKHFALQGG